MQTLFQYKKNGSRVRQVGGHSDNEGFLLVQGETGPPFYASRKSLMPCDEQGNPDRDATAELPDIEDTPEGVPPPKMGVIETRLNLNTASAEEIARRIPGIGYTTAKRIKSVQLAQPGEVFRSLDQIQPLAPRANWTELLAANTFFLG